MNPEDFYTRSGIIAKFTLEKVDGKNSSHWLMVGGIESTPWRKNRQDRMKLRLAQSISGVIDLEKDSDRDSAQLLSKLVVDWSFEQTFTQKAVEDFLYNTPYIMDQLDTFISNKANFLKKK